jgi:hypothetical protein
MKERIYVCHTYYHVYITLLKELKIRAEEGSSWAPHATLILSKMSTDFEELHTRLSECGLFDEILDYDEKRESFFPELDSLRSDTGSGLGNLRQRIRLTRRFAQLQEPFLPVDFRQYKQIYVFCDADPIGVYLNQKHIRYHAVEDGLNCIANGDLARFDNRGHFPLKAFLSLHLNLIFIPNGYGKYCIDMEINDRSRLIYQDFRKYIEVPRLPLRDRLTDADRELILKVFLKNKAALEQRVAEASKAGDGILLLTEPLCTLEIRKQIFTDLIERYQKEGTVFLKPHPRDELDYETLFPEIPQIDKKVPMEMLHFMPGAHFKKAVGVLTEMSDFPYADESIRLGPDFLDAYEEPSIHRQNEQI